MQNLNLSILDQYKALGIKPISGGENDPPGGGDPPKDPPKDPPADPAKPDGKTYTQEEMEAVLQRRLAKQATNLQADLEKQIREKIEQESKEAEAKEQGEYKTLYDQAQEKIKKFEEEVERLKGEQEAKTWESIRDAVAAKHNLPKDLWDRLQGEDEKSLEADAKKVAALLKLEAPNTEGGAGKSSTNKGGEKPSPAYTFRRSPVVKFPERMKSTGT